MTEDQKFKVDLNGIIDLLSDHIYTTPSVFVREFLQNATDAIQVRKLSDDDFKPKITIELFEEKVPRLVITDNGIGLTKQEISNFLSVIGESSKRNKDFQDEFIGKFGIGLLSGFVISDYISVITKSESDTHAYQWLAKPDGTYTITQLDKAVKKGTSVELIAKSDMMYYFKRDTLEELLTYYGEALPFPIHFLCSDTSTIINATTPLWLQDDVAKKDLIRYGKQELSQDFIDAFPINIKELKLKGTAFISKKRLHLNAKNESKVFVKQMLLSERIENLLPKWFFFVKIIINVDDLTPTASRESFVQDTSYKICKDLLHQEIKNYLKEISKTNPTLFSKILSTHYESIKMLANKDETLLELFLDHLVFETNKGRKNFYWIKENIATIHFTQSLEDFKQIKRIASSKDIFIINAAYSFEGELIKSIQKKYPAINLQPISPFDILNDFEEIDVNEQDRFAAFITATQGIMNTYFCDVSVKKFLPADVPVLFICDDESINNYQKDKLSNDTNNPFASIFNTSNEDKKPTLCFNLNNDLTRSLIGKHEHHLFHSMIKMLYVQSLFLGQFPINKQEMEILNLSMNTIIDNL